MGHKFAAATRLLMLSISHFITQKEKNEKEKEKPFIKNVHAMEAIQ